MNKNIFREITTERLFLRRLKQTDWVMISYLGSDMEVNQFVKRPNADSKEKALVRFAHSCTFTISAIASKLAC